MIRLFRISPLLLPVLILAAAIVRGEKTPTRQFHVWASSCCHVPADILRGRESLARAIRQSEGLIPGITGFDWDIMIDAGDLSAHQYPPGDPDGQELQRQYRALTKHRREQIYNVQGNHDAPYYDHGPGSWFRKWGDPMGEFTTFSGVDPKRRPFPVEGNWERYRFVAGNILFLMLADRNDAPTPVGRGHSRERKRGGYPPGAVTRETFEWWKEQVLANQDKLIISMHHHALRDTTVASGNGEGNPTYHGATGGAAGSSYLYFLIENDDPEDFRYTPDAHVFEDFLDEFHKEHGRGAIDLWVAGHTHVKGPDDDFGGKTITETRWGVHFLQAAALTRHHGGSHPLSRVLTFTEGKPEVKVRAWLHEASFKNAPIGFYEPVTRILPLRHPFEAPPEIEPMPPFPPETKRFDKPYPSSKRTSSTVATIEAPPSPDLTEHWDRKTGAIHLPDAAENIPAAVRPGLVSDSPDTGTSAKFAGRQRIRIGPVEMRAWDSLTVAAWIKTTRNDPNMRIISKDDIGTPGNFVLLQKSPDTWEMRVWDSTAKAWATATSTVNLSDDRWHHLCGTVDGNNDRVALFVNGALAAEGKWNADTLDDSDGTDVVIGSDSGVKRFGHTFRGLLHDVRLLNRALNGEEIRRLVEEKEN